jgi:hypothetical protein
VRARKKQQNGSARRKGQERAVNTGAGEGQRPPVATRRTRGQIKEQGARGRGSATKAKGKRSVPGTCIDAPLAADK